MPTSAFTTNNCARRCRLAGHIGARARLVAPCAYAKERRALLGCISAAALEVVTNRAAQASNLDDDFLGETRALADAMKKYMELDPFDKERMSALAYIKTDGKKWIAAHAKGGSAPGQAAKRMYVAVDAVLGWVTSNGAAPLPKQKVKFVKETLGQVESLLSQDK